MQSKDTNVRRYAWLLLEVYGTNRAPEIAADLCEALALINDAEMLQTWEQVRRLTKTPINKAGWAVLSRELNAKA